MHILCVSRLCDITVMSFFCWSIYHTWSNLPLVSQVEYCVLSAFSSIGLYSEYWLTATTKRKIIVINWKGWWILTWEFPVYSVDSAVQQKVASLPNPSGCCYSGPALSEKRTGSWELKTELHSFCLRGYSYSVWREIINIGKHISNVKMWSLWTKIQENELTRN